MIQFFKNLTMHTLNQSAVALSLAAGLATVSIPMGATVAVACECEHCEGKDCKKKDCKSGKCKHKQGKEKAAKGSDSAEKKHAE